MCAGKFSRIGSSALVSFRFARLPVLLALLGLGEAAGQAPAASRVVPNLESNLERPLRYRPDGPDFVIETGAETFNRSLYGGNTAFRVDGGDRPEFLLYLPGRGGNLRLGVQSAGGARWLHEAARITMRYRPGSLRYEIRDPLLGDGGVVRLTALAYFQTEGLVVEVEAEGLPSGLELVWAYGGVNGQRGARDGDIGTERVPISQYFQLQAAFCEDNGFDLTEAGFTLRAKPATLVGIVPTGSRQGIADAAHWNHLPALLQSASATSGTPTARPVATGRVALANRTPLLISLQRIAADSVVTEDLATYRAVGAAPAAVLRLPPAFDPAELRARFIETEQHFTALRTRVIVETPDPFLNAAVGALNVAADAVWDEPQQAIMHGAIAWRTKLLGWRGPYALDTLGWHDRSRTNFLYWTGRQNTKPIPESLPPADENANLARNETGLHSNGDLSNSHYDMNLVFIDALFRHLRWTGDLEFAKTVWPVIERHLAWERRLFRREFGPEKLPLYEAYAAIWASDDLQYHGGGAMHASAYNFLHHREAARLARLIGADPAPYESEAQLLARGMREHLWLADRGHFGEFKDLLGLQRVHPSAALWTFYHTVDSEVPTPEEAWQMMRQVDTEIPRLPVRGPGVPAGLYTLSTTHWMPYSWSINNVVMAEVMHTALGFYRAGRPEDAWKMMKGSLLAAMYMGICPGNVGSMSYLDVYRRESQRDFADGSGVLARTLIEGLFGIRPDALSGELELEPGFPGEWNHASLRHPQLSLRFQRTGDTDTYTIEPRFSRPLNLRLRLRAQRDQVAQVTVNGREAPWQVIETSIGTPRIEMTIPAGAHHAITVRWAGDTPAQTPPTVRPGFVQVTQGQMRWWTFSVADRVHAPADARVVRGPTDGTMEPIDLTAVFNDHVTQIFKNEYRSPRSPFVSLAMPKQGIGAWAGHVNATAVIDDSGLRAAAAKHGERFILPSGVPFATPSAAEEKNIVFTSQWDNYPRAVTVPLHGRARHVHLLMAGSTNFMQSRIDNGEVVVTYTDGSTTRLALENPTTWWPIDADYFIDDFQFRVDSPLLPLRVNLRTGETRSLELPSFKGRGGTVPGGAATVLELPLDTARELQSLTVRTLSNEVVIGLMAATLVRVTTN